MDIKNITSPGGGGIHLASVKSTEHKSEDPLVKQAQQSEVIQLADKAAKESNEKQRAVAEKKNIDKAVTDINQFFQTQQRKLSFSVNEATSDMVIEIKDADTDEIIRQIPPEFVVRLAEQLKEMTDDPAGILLKDRA